MIHLQIQTFHIPRLLSCWSGCRTILQWRSRMHHWHLFKSSVLPPYVLLYGYSLFFVNFKTCSFCYLIKRWCNNTYDKSLWDTSVSDSGFWHWVWEKYLGLLHFIYNKCIIKSALYSHFVNRYLQRLCQCAEVSGLARGDFTCSIPWSIMLIIIPQAVGHGPLLSQLQFGLDII